MLKKFGATAMLLLIIVSFTVGSVSPVDVPSKKHGNAMMFWQGMAGEMSPAIGGAFQGVDGDMPFIIGAFQGACVAMQASGGAVMAAGGVHTDNRFTNVVVDLSGQGAMPEETYGWHAPGFMPPFWGIQMIPCNDHIDGNVIVRQAGSDTQSTFPVKFLRHQMPDMMEKGLIVSYTANATIPLNDDHGSFMTFHGEVLVTNGSIMYNANSNVLPEEGYDNDISMGQTNWHQAQVSGMSTAFNFDLKWNDPDDDLRLTVYTPDGHVLGPYTDVSDGKTDGRINMEINNEDGVADGTWLFKVTGTGVSGKDEYYIRTW
jgi:hypothetical protein